MVPKLWPYKKSWEKVVLLGKQIVRELDVLGITLLRVKNSMVGILQNNNISGVVEGVTGIDPLMLKLEIEIGTITNK